MQVPHSQEELNIAKEFPWALQERPDDRMYMNAVDLLYMQRAEYLKAEREQYWMLLSPRCCDSSLCIS